MMSFPAALDYGDLVFRQAVEGVHEAVDFGVGSLYLALDRSALGLRLGRRKWLQALRKDLTSALRDVHFFVWHSHTTNTRQPSRVSALRLLRSRIRFRSNFTCQYSTCEAGMDRPSWQECRCQKQP